MNRHSQSSEICDQDVQELDQFAEKSLESDRLSEVLEEVPLLVQRGAVYLISAAVVLTLALLYFGKVHVAVTVKGTILPKGETLQVLALASGTATKVLAREGDHLPEGAPILKFSHRQSDLELISMKRNFKLKQNQLDTALESARVLKEILADVDKYLNSKQEILVTDNTMQAITALKKSWLDLQKAGQMQQEDFKDKMRLMEREINLAEQNIALKEKNLASAEEELKQQKQILEKKRQRYEEFLKLAQRGFYSKIDVDNEAERFRSAELAVSAKEKEIDQMKLDISNERLRLADKKIRLKTEKSDADDRYETAEMSYRQNLTALLLEQNNIQSGIDRLEAEIRTDGEKISLMESQISQGAVVMPANGTITLLHIKNPGETIGSGSTVAIVVADSESLIVKASAESKDVGFIVPGLQARVKVDAYPFQQFGTIPGLVTKVFPNIGGDGQFTVNIRLKRSTIKSMGHDIRLIPGLTVQADLLTRKQRLIYMLLSKQN